MRSDRLFTTIDFHTAGIGMRLLTAGLGRLPGDFRFRLFGRDWFIPLASSVLLSFVAMLIGQIV